MNDLAALTRSLDDRFLDIHERKETAFWNTRMAIVDQGEALARAEVEMKSFLGDVNTLGKLREMAPGAEPELAHVAAGWILTFERNAIKSPEGRKLYEANVEAERDLAKTRQQMKLGYVEPSTGEFVEASSVALGNGVVTGTREPFRRACREGLQGLEEYLLANGFPEIVKLRNRFARAEGFQDFYDYKAWTNEGFGKDRVFEFLDDLERRTRDLNRDSLASIARELGASAIEPWNLSYYAGGSLAAEREPYTRFEDSLERWLRSFAALGIRYRGARLTLDLVERPGKYENGFMHGTRPAYERDGEWVPAVINFTANAIPDRVGSGQRATRTLFHEGGHAAHFANVRQGSPCFGHEFAPMSSAHAETQAIVVDSLLGDADWQTRYERDASGTPVPFELIERTIRMGRRLHAQYLRTMMAICYAERGIYELSDDEVTADRLREIFRETEARLVQTPGGAPRPILSVPHLLSWESSAYYHSYVLARIAVSQTRQYFLERDGHLVDNPRIGPELARVYWAPGSGRPFLELVETLTGKPLSADALVDETTLTADAAVARAREKVDRLADIPAFDETPDLDVELAVAHGKEVVVEPGTPYGEAVQQFQRWVVEGWPRQPEAGGAG